jgi:hypothetical protein
MAINIQKRIKFIEAYKNNMAGNITRCCKEAGVSRIVYYTKWMKSKKKIIDGKTFAEIIQDIDQQVLDDAEQIYKGIAMVDKDKTALFNFLRKKHPDWKDSPIGMGIIDMNEIDKHRKEISDMMDYAKNTAKNVQAPTTENTNEGIGASNEQST